MESKDLLEIDEYANFVGIPVSELKSRSQKQYLCIARQVYWLYLNCSGLGYRRISKRVGRAAETVYSGICTVKNLIETNDLLMKPYHEFVVSFYSKR